MFDAEDAHKKLRKVARTKGVVSGGERDITWNLRYKIDMLESPEDVRDIVHMIRGWQERLTCLNTASPNFRKISEKGMERTRKLLDRVLETAEDLINSPKQK